MTKRSTKRALLMSVLALLVCASMLVGTTFAWFTDSVTSAGNKIQSGTLKIDLELLKDSGWVSIKENPQPIFNYNNWEPGYTDVKVLKIENEGTLALKWYAKVVTAGGLSTLADVIDVYVLPSETELAMPADRDLTGYTKVGTVRDFVAGIETSTKGTLLPAGENNSIAYLGIALKMQESAGNKYQGLDLAGAFDIQILATQLNYEPDSFDENYDANLDLMENGISKVLDDGSTAFYYSAESGYGNRVRLTEIPENITEYTVPAEVNDLGGALVGKTLDKLTVSSNVEYAYKSLEGATIDTVVLEEGTDTVPNRMFYKANVNEIVIPETVTVIEENAFAMAAATELVIPASVTVAGEAAFQHMPNLTKVTFEGNTAIEGYAFRGCANLRTVVLKGNDVTFIPSATGKNSCWFCNGESNNPNTSDIDFYVVNETVAARVKTAMGAEANNTDVYVNGQLYVPVKNATELQAALDNAIDETLIVFTNNIAGDVTVTQPDGSDIDVVINGNGYKFDGTMTVKGLSSNGADTFTIKNINFETATSGTDFIWSANTAAGSDVRYAHNVTIDNCTFTATGAAVNTVVGARFQQAYNITLTNCTATGVHSLLQAESCQTTVKVDNCNVVNSKNGVSLNNTMNAVVTNTTINSVVEGGYGIRHKGQEPGYALTVENSTVSAFVPVLVRNLTGSGYSVTFNGTNNLTATNDFGYEVVLSAGDWDNDAAQPSAPTGSYTITGADSFNVFNG